MKRTLVVLLFLGLCGTAQGAEWQAVHALGPPLPAPFPEIRNEPCPGLPENSCTAPGGPIWLNPAALRPAHSLWHELGHQFDYTRLRDSDRDTFKSILKESRPWDAAPNAPKEQFAEAYALCALREGRNGAYGYHPSRTQYRRVCRLVRSF